MTPDKLIDHATTERKACVFKMYFNEIDAIRSWKRKEIKFQAFTLPKKEVKDEKDKV